MKTSNKKPKVSKKLFILTSASIVFVAALGYLGYAYATKSAWPFLADGSSSMTSEDGINYAPPTDQELENSQNGKKNSASQAESNTSTNSPNSVSVGIAYAGYDESERSIDIRAFTSSVVEGDGTCTATLTKDSQTVTRTSKAFIDSSSSQCEPILIETGEFPSGGLWSLIVSYQSNTSSGTSSPVQVEVNQ